MYGHTWQKNAHILKNVELSFPIYPDKRTYLRSQQFKLFEFKNSNAFTGTLMHIWKPPICSCSYKDNTLKIWHY